MRFLITAGPTREYLDSVRFLTNGSSGRMGYACASAALRRGHKVVLVSGPVELPRPKGVRLVQVVSSEQMREAVCEQVPGCDCVVMTAAVCDYRPQHRHEHKLAKTGENLTLELERTTDILAELGNSGLDKVLIGFALLVFYTLLLSLSEYLTFNSAYLISSLSIILLITGYTISILKSRVYTSLILIILLILYFLLVSRFF